MRALTYRKISFLLLFLATMVLAAAWLGSLRTWREWRVIAQPCTFDFSLRSGTAGVSVATYGAVGHGVFPMSRTPAQSGDARLPEYHPLGRFRMDRIPLRRIGSAGHHEYSLEIPVWLPYLLFIAGTVAWWKIRSRQTDAATEQAMATRNAAETQARNEI